jgi:Transglutaminase-like superfamily
MKRLVIESWLLLFYFDCLMHFRGFGRTHSAIRRQRVVYMEKRHEVAVLCRASDFACVFYFKPVKCLQRSAATTVLLRRRGWKAEMVVGAQLLPFQSHAWVEIEGAVANDKPYMREIFQELARY